jgi:ubiquinone/menaquinone biosynthesis C-methylase UbiE
MAKAKAPGIVFRWPRAYDWLLRLMWGSREKRYRERVLELAGIGPGQRVLDIGCGTGTQALAARELVGDRGQVCGIDASPEMVARARSKAEAMGLYGDFREAAAQALPFVDASFDVIISTTVIHCLPEDVRALCFAEMARVLKPDGKVLLVDFGGSSRHTLAGHAGIHGRFDLTAERERIAAAGLVEIASGPVGLSDLQFILARPRDNRR